MVAAKLTDIKDSISFSQAAKLYPNPVAPETVARHAMHGISGVRLFSFMSAGRRRTTAAAVEEFLQRVNEARNAKRADSSGSNQVEQTAENGRQAAKVLAGLSSPLMWYHSLGRSFREIPPGSRMEA